MGWEYAHVAIDDHSRLSYVEVLPNLTGGNVKPIPAGVEREIAAHRRATGASVD